MADDGPPPVKRRKLSPALDSIPSRYIVLTRATCVVTLQVTTKSTSPPFDQPLAIRSLTRSQHGLHISLKGGAKRSAIEVVANVPIDAFVDDLLRDCHSVPALATAPASRHLQACHNAICYESEDGLTLEVQLLWCNTTSIWDKVDDSLLQLLRRYLPSQNMQEPEFEDWHPRDFYDNVHVPSKDSDLNNINVDRFNTSLYPFQRRTLRWMLHKEGVDISHDGQITPHTHTASLPLGFAEVRADDGAIYYVNHALGVVSSNFNEVVNAFGVPKGGLLADEMGLGKTLAVVGTVCAHQRPKLASAIQTTSPRRSGATLIITPPTLLEQWREEVTEHSSDLKVEHYEGLASRRVKKTGFRDLVTMLAESDIVLTTYNVISREVHYVTEKPDRALRHKKVVEIPKSPLTEISWWRVCLDEAQMVESGVSNAATVARLIPREIAWAVTGTPLRSGHKDLYGLMVFLRHQPWCWSARLWDRLVDCHRPLFRSMIHDTTIRHTKDFIREDLRLPPQSRHMITLPFTAIEEQHYENLFDEMCNAVNLRADGSPQTDDWNPEDPKIVEAMRKWLSRLRQTCLHPEVGARNRKALGRGGGPLRTVGQVLDVMIDQVEGNLRTEQRSLLMSQIRRGQMLENAKLPKIALELWETAYREATIIVKECQERLDEEIRNQAEEASKSRRQSSDSDSKQDEDDIDVTVQACRQRLRSALEIQHICIFFMGNAFFQLKSDEENVKPESEEFHTLEKKETEAYNTAKEIRGLLLTEALKKANGYIKSVQEKDTATPEGLKEMEAHPRYAGIESRKIFEKLHYFCAAMNEQATYFQTMRAKMIDFLKQALIDDDAGVELQGDEYEASTKHQDEMYVYMEALRVLFADRNDAVTGLRNELIRHEVKFWLRNAKEGEGAAPELMLKLMGEREGLRIDPDKQGSLRGIVTEIRHLVVTLQTQEAAGSSRVRAELEVAESLYDYVQQLMSASTKGMTTLEQEVNLFRDTMNSRLDYYRALQKISDTVAPYEEDRVGEPLNQTVFDSTLEGERHVSTKISMLMSKRRYLIHLKEESNSSAPRICTICQCEFEVGTLTVCGHQFCKECIQLWWHENKNCPVCKRRLHTQDFHDITYKPAQMAVQVESPASGSLSPSSSTDNFQQQSIYSEISVKTLNEIKNIDLHGPSFGSKVDMLMRHILWLRDHDLSIKIIIFSQYRDFLDVLSRAFKQHHVTYSDFDERNGIHKFKTDPTVECFLLHAKAHSAGLNLVCASHVFLCEPLLATAVELQAIARVHRIGQHRATTVWMYVIGGTVEESIYELSVARRLEHIKRNVKRVGKSKANSTTTSGVATPKLGENVIDMANSLELQEADMKKLLSKGKGGGEHVDKGDLWQCLFGKTRVKEAVMADMAPAGGEIGRFLRAEAAEARSASC